ncbi:uncharacterized protein E0L32_004807 [Thyridium curvatum]|uniref:C2H2-type domain-containing protein n=1 Tax=Thyridium curvatum TaxID=1093900 RepID=A0A507B5E2_9PEZI|nr:uncharacterized protein E0L32_004807 [Thyridium curvatum]TPX14977.1 hypothetical protein E0L32_004807 [Thyridium curvatum]
MSAMQSAYGSYPHTPRTPATPNTPGSNNNMGNYPPPPNQNAGRGSYPMMPNNPYGQPHQPYGTQSMLPQTTTTMSHPQPIAPAPSPGARGPPVLRPMPTGGVMPQQGMQSPYGQSPLMPQPSMLPEGEQPTHVVGSQGRRGILPSAPGRPAAPAAGTAGAKAQVPQKDADGKFPCPHCTKTYLHAKHLKRHLLRHTGDRPYMCVLCRDTFSRSDILKRHFQKCSIRRGNPTGASHLSHPHAHVKKNPAAQKPLPEGDLSHMNGMGSMPADGIVHPFGFIPAQDGGLPNMTNDQSNLSRSGSINRLEDANDRDRRNMTGSVMGASRGASFDQSFNGNVPNSMAANINPQLANYPMPPSSNGMPMFGGQNQDWSQMFQAGAQNTYVNNTFQPNDGQTQIATKPVPNPEPVTTDGFLPGDHGLADDRSLFLGNWAPPFAHDPYQQLSNQILSFFYPPDSIVNPQTAGLNLYFAPDNVKDFLEKYTHFHVHFAILHIPTFRIMDAYTGLLAAMCCVGACYSSQVSADNVREMMNFLWTALQRDSSMLASLNSAQLDDKYRNGTFASSARDIEEFQAIMLMHTIFTWNGTPEQRDATRKIFPLISTLARNAGLLSVVNDASLHSPLHQPGVSIGAFDPSTFDWDVWVQQEKRIRIMYFIFLVDTAMGLYFNSPPVFDPMEVKLPLPADDAAWDAHSGTQCAECLGLHGPEAARQRNPDGTQRAKQPELHLALQALLHGSYQMQTGTTNLYGKFIIIHALLALMRKAQSQGHAASIAGSSTPLLQNDWIVPGHDSTGPNSGASNSGRGTPVEGIMPTQTLKSFIMALDKFKRNWDSDMAHQFLPSSRSARRHGFSRDGVHFYWLANYMVKHTQPSDLQLAPDQRFAQVIHLLKSVKSWVMSDGAARGEELGSIGEIDRNFGEQGGLTLNMVSLFKPLPKVVESPEITSVKTAIGTNNLM